ncbi:hypothetical protein BDN71DRAFT_1401874, partial [Pleurotus eryngii]
VPFGVTYEKIGTIQRRLAWPLHKDDTLSRSGRPTGLNIYFLVSRGLRIRPERCTHSCRRHDSNILFSLSQYLFLAMLGTTVDYLIMHNIF